METQKYLFWFEDEGKDGWTFIIEAMDSDEAFEKAYDTHGPQVEGMMYQLIDENNATLEAENKELRESNRELVNMLDRILDGDSVNIPGIEELIRKNKERP